MPAKGKRAGRYNTGRKQPKPTPKRWSDADRDHYDRLRGLLDSKLDTEAEAHDAAVRLVELDRICVALDGTEEKTGDEWRGQVSAISQFMKLLDRYGLAGLKPEPEEDDL